jgi:hypothetical protein
MLEPLVVGVLVDKVGVAESRRSAEARSASRPREQEQRADAGNDDPREPPSHYGCSRLWRVNSPPP